MLKDYVVTQKFKSPYVVSTGMPHNPTKIMFKRFNKGEVIRGELKTENGQPAFVMVKGTIVVPLSVIREVITKQIGFSSASGEFGAPEKKKIDIKKPVTVKMHYLDAAIVGALVGFGFVYLAEKKSWIVASEESPYQNKLIGVFVGAGLGAYFTYRFKQPKEKTPKE